MNRSSRAALVAAAGATLVLSTSPALAHGDSEHRNGEGYVPVETVIPDYYAPFSVTDACGDQDVLIETGDVRGVVIRQTELPNGTLVQDYRGGLTLDLTREDGATIDELDVSGDLREVIAPDGLSAVVTLEGPSVIFPLPGEESFFDDEGLPYLAFFKRGVVTLNISLDPDTGETESFSAEVHARIVDLCRWFDGHQRRAHHQDYGHGNRHGGGHGHWDGHGHGHK